MSGPGHMPPRLPRRVPVPGEEFVWMLADPAGGWSDMVHQVADVLGEAEGGWLVEYGLPGLPQAPAVLLALDPSLATGRTRRTVIEWTDGRWARRIYPEERATP